MLHVRFLIPSTLLLIPRIISGVYEFTMGADGSKVMARYSFVYVKEDSEWKIAHHHSSAMPEGMMAAAAKIKELESILSMSK